MIEVNHLPDWVSCGLMSVEILRWLVVPVLNVHRVRLRSSLPARLVFLAPEAASTCPSDTNSKKKGSPNPARFQTPQSLTPGASG